MMGPYQKTSSTTRKARTSRNLNIAYDPGAFRPYINIRLVVEW